MDPERPYCFGKLENVFPMGSDDLRCTPESCFPCRCKTECLRAALQSHEGIAVREEQIDRAYSAGMLSFLERWSKKKTMHRKRAVSTGEKEERDP